MDNLNREQAPFPDFIWERIDAAAVDAARALLTGRRFLEVEGPFGPGLTALELGADDYCRDPGEREAGAIVSKAISVPMLRKSCRLSARRLAAYLDKEMPLSLADVEDAAEAVARREEEFIYFGQTDFGLEGLLNAKGRNKVKATDWSGLDKALNNVLAAITTLDNAGFHGPYSLALPPTQYNNLFRHYEHTDLLQIEHLKSLCTLGVYKAAVNMPVAVDSHAGSIVLGQDLRVGYAGSDGIHYQLFVCESMVLRLDQPDAVCVLTN
ncbi:family 1 encapsulin nanocompartment shell protein [Sulfuriflexus sp.]|uniref:family 1 encapsulin nanocompartment shell protein n=1 Tax=Sulfuriflexus sp. TaxID=2015443 RepID=UPI0028CCA8BF|nr:family 1 encapsulin nanocompartment shell protein [Sulfuriflexus sp.]MDT8405148.1 family 1 encapsulin nanocompartment shell protein [Sulfuriflexus sp.]